MESHLVYGTPDPMKAQQPHHLPPSTINAERALSPVERFRRADDREWHWLEDRDDPQVVAFLEAANAEYQGWMAPLEGLIDRLYHGHLARRELTVHGLRTALDHYTYWSETTADADYPVWWRHRNDREDEATPFLDLQARAAAQHYLELGDMALSPDERWLAWTEDTSGDERFSLQVAARRRAAPAAGGDRPGTDLGRGQRDLAVHPLRCNATPR